MTTVMILIVALAQAPVGEKPPTWLSLLASEDETEANFLDGLASSDDFHKLLEKAKAEGSEPAITVVRELGKLQGQDFKQNIGVPRKNGPLTEAFKQGGTAKQVAERLVKNDTVKKMAKAANATAKQKIADQRKEKLKAPGFGHLFVEDLNVRLATTEGMIMVQVTCSPQTGPADMRVILARQGRRTPDEAHPPLARAALLNARIAPAVRLNMIIGPSRARGKRSQDGASTSPVRPTSA